MVSTKAHPLPPLYWHVAVWAPRGPELLRTDEVLAVTAEVYDATLDLTVHWNEVYVLACLAPKRL